MGDGDDRNARLLEQTITINAKVQVKSKILMNYESKTDFLSDVSL